ncbi:transposase, partial [Actibacterium sp. 188UL27-1]|uniref:IS66 family transposase n=1 Tax=Actibacterium sp. 188UL27-1 TaxID=2786961 RepID=UPI001959BC47|nr:transposase [Actibacterium sp. 188UL27-1]
MSEDTTSLSDDRAVLRAIIASLEAENVKLLAPLRARGLLVQTLRTRIAKLQKQAFGKSSEKIEREIAQLELALEDLQVAMAEADETAAPDGDTEEDIVAPSAAEDEKPPRRRPRISKDAPHERRELDPGDNCPECGGDLRVLGEDVSELIDMIAAQLKVIEIARIKKSCRRCEKIVQEPAPSRPIPRSMAGPGLLAYILTSKFDDHWTGTKSEIAKDALDRIGQLYDIERDIKGLPADERHAVRQRKTKPQVDAFYAWAEAQLTRIPGKSDLAKAFRYCFSRWPSFTLILEDGRVAIDN